MRGVIEDCRSYVLRSIFLFALVLAPGCAEKSFQESTPSAGPPLTLPPAQPVSVELKTITYQETGIASWYGREFQGRRTASGELFDMHALSAAHRTLPLGTVIHVTNLENLKTVRVKVNDRGPFAVNRMLELSYGAARELGFTAQGTASVRIETPDPLHEDSPYSVQAAVYAEEESAQVLKYRLSRKYEVVVIVPFETNLGKFYQVRVGSYGTEEKAELIAGKLKLEGLEPVVIKKD